MGNALNVPDWAHQAFQTFGIVDHHTHYIDADEWTAVATDAGTVTETDGKGGLLTLAASDGTAADNDETYLKQSNETLKFEADKPIYLGSRLQYTEADTNAANIAFGCMNAVAANSILDDGAGPAADYSGAVLYKVDGGTKWIFETSVGTSQTTTTSTKTAGGSAYQELEIFIEAYSATQLQAYPKVDGKQLLDANGKPIIHFITIGSATEMQAFYAVKAGSTTAQTLVVDTTVALQKV